MLTKDYFIPPYSVTRLLILWMIASLAAVAGNIAISSPWEKPQIVPIISVLGAEKTGDSFVITNADPQAIARFSPTRVKRISIDLGAKLPADFVQVYWKEEGGFFAEKDSAIFYPVISGRKNVFTFSIAKNLTAIRIDPLQPAGEQFSIRNLTLNPTINPLSSIRMDWRFFLLLFLLIYLHSANAVHTAAGENRPLARREILDIALLSLSIVLVTAILEIDVGINWLDEGVVWYGAQRVLEGEIPMHDFFAYSPARYYWSAMWLYLMDTGLLSMRYSYAALQAIALLLGLLAIRRVISSFRLLAVFGIVISMWMYPGYKIYDAFIPLAAIYVSAFLLESPTVRRHFATGLFLGIASMMGRHHALYLSLAFLVFFFYLALKGRGKGLLKNIGAFAVGGMLGYMPMILMFMTIPGYFGKVFEIVQKIATTGSTDFPLPVPVPWHIDYSGMGAWDATNAVAIGLLFIIVPLSYFAYAYVALRARSENSVPAQLLLSCAIVGFFYLHYIFKRADWAHLALGIQPFLIGLPAFALLLRPFAIQRVQAVTGALILCTSILSIGMEHEFVKMWRGSERYVGYQVAEKVVWLPAQEALLIHNIKREIAKHVKPGEEIFIGTSLPTVYAFLYRRSPVWNIVLFMPETAERQRRMIASLEEKVVNWALISDTPIDNLDRYHYRNTYPLVYRYFKKNFKRVPARGFPKSFALLERKNQL